MAEFSPLKSRRLSDEIGDAVRKRLASGELQPGDKLPPERDLAVQFNVSRNAVREALRMLESNGVISLHKGAKGGAFVSKGDAGFLTTGFQDLLYLKGATIEQITEARVWLGQIVTRVACERATESEFDMLDRNIDEAEAAYLRGDLERKLVLQIEFHNVLAATTRNPVLILIVESIGELMLGFALKMGPEDNDRSIQSRRRLMTLLRARNVEGATSEITAHLESLKLRYIALMGKREQR